MYTVYVPSVQSCVERHIFHDFESVYCSIDASDRSLRLETAIRVALSPFLKVRVTSGESVVSSPLLMMTWNPSGGRVGEERLFP